jgi:hypothetical protein
MLKQLIAFLCKNYIFLYNINIKENNNIDKNIKKI